MLCAVIDHRKGGRRKGERLRTQIIGDRQKKIAHFLSFAGTLLPFATTPFLLLQCASREEATVHRSSMAKSSHKQTAAKSSSKPARRRRAPVQVVTCPPDFPNSTDKRPSTPRRDDRQKERNHDKNDLELNDVAREVHSLGATAFLGDQKREFLKKEYLKLTGRAKKNQKVPLHIVRGIRKKASERLTRQREEARDAGVVLPTLEKEAKKRKRTLEGPAPSIGFLKKGVLRVKKKP